MESFLRNKFTHIIVGGGTAGLAVAARLSDNPDLTVGVLEAGSTAFKDPRINVPGRFGESLGSEYDWKFETTPQAGLNGRKLPFPRGKVLGGTSALNFMTWNRGCREDYDAWEELGNEGWGWEGMLPFFKKSETFHSPDAEHQARHQSHFDAEYHGTEGPLQTVYSVEYGASHQHWHATLHKLGVQTNHSHFSGSNVGVWTSLTGVTPKLRERSYSATAYYKPNCERPNLVLLTEALVREVVLEKEPDGWIARGVRFMHEGKEHVVRAEGEVVLCAGTVQSPQLLELSGIGNPDILKAAGIEVKVANPNVGENLQEHMMTAMVFEIEPSMFTPEDLRADPVLAAAADKTYADSQSGPRTAIPSSVAYLPFSHFIPPSELPTLRSSLLSQSPPNSMGVRDRILADRLSSQSDLGQIEFNFDVSNYSPYFRSLPGKKYATMLQMLQYPFSTGSIHIPPRKPTEKMMVASQKFANRICSTKPLANIIVSRVFPPPSSPAVEREEEDFAEWVRDSTITDWHPVGTCAMGGKEAEKEGVVDARLGVYGVRGLRVVDASIMPLQISAHLQATVYAIGEKGAELIMEDWRKREKASTLLEVCT
ncbi:hypothetical protein MMC30_009395 [Trapelia coarctata]|nr:hypothetical protein [Trapelia coarctata]